MCQHDFQGRRILQHRNLDKWDLFLLNQRVEDFWFEQECREYIVQLRNRWDGTIGANFKARPPARLRAQRGAGALRFEAIMISCNERKKVCDQTLGNLATTDWGDSALYVHMDKCDQTQFQERLADLILLALKESLKRPADYVLLLEDDLDFNRHLRHNLLHWQPLKTGQVTLASLYNPRVRELAADVPNNARIADPHSIFGSQAFLLSKETVAHLVRRWADVECRHDVKIGRLAARLNNPIFYHAPSLVQHIEAPSAPNTGVHRAIDFHPTWTA